MLITFMSITGADEAVAQQMLAAADHNLEGAVSLFFDTSPSAFAVDQNSPAPAPVPFPSAAFGEPRGESVSVLRKSGLPDWYEVVWGNAEPAASWTSQPLEFLGHPTEPFSGVGLVQPSNGPCGVLSVITAVVIAQCRLKPDWGPDFRGGDQDLAEALVAIFQTVAASSTGVVSLCSWGTSQGRVGTDVVPSNFTIGHEVEKAVPRYLPQLKAPGGLLLILYSCVLTRGVDKIVADARHSGGEPPLIVAPHSLCTSELLALMMKGVADGNMSAYSPVGCAKTSWRDGSRYALPIGMLSALEYPEYESAEGGSLLPLADELKSPQVAVWIIHSSSMHFTVAFNASEETDSVVLSEAPGEFELHHWNGLPPGGPKITTLRVNALNGVAPPAADIKSAGERPHYKPVVNHEGGSEIDSVIQASVTDKRAFPNKWEMWRYEVMLSMPEDAIDGQDRPEGMPLPRLYQLPPEGPDPTAPWRCATCYRTRFQTMNFGDNEAGAEFCKTCGQAPHDAGFSIWLHFNDLPASQQALLARRHAPKIVSIVHTKWPGAAVTFNPLTGVPSV